MENFNDAEFRKFCENEIVRALEKIEETKGPYKAAQKELNLLTEKNLFKKFSSIQSNCV